MIRDRGGKPGRASAFWRNSVWGAFALRRLGWSLATVAGVVAITFLISHIIPADPAALAAGERATREQVADPREITDERCVGELAVEGAGRFA